MNLIKYTIIIPTCNKNLTERCMEYICCLNKPRDEYEVLIVHNVAKDYIKSVTNEYMHKIPNLRDIYEEKSGLMSSRHRGAKEAQGIILCYLDDDSFVDKNWLIAIEETFMDSEVVLAGGNNVPLYEVSPPKWLNYFWEKNEYGRWMMQLSLIEFHNKRMKLPAWFAFGCNFIIRKDSFFQMSGTNPDSFPKDKQRFQGDGETALSLKLNEQGYVLDFNPEIKIQHLIPQERLTLEYFRRRAFIQGVSDSFSKIRKESKFAYYNFTPNQNIEKYSIFARIFLRILKRIERLILFNILKKDYIQYLNVKAEYKKSCSEGFDFHQNEVKNDPELLKWVLKRTYLE